MAYHVCKFQDGETAYYLLWSTVVDAPITFGVPLNEFLADYQTKCGTVGVSELRQQMPHVEQHGTSARGTLDELIDVNRAGKDETCLTREQIVEWYCRRKVDCQERGAQHSTAE